MEFRVYIINEDIETSSGLFGITQAFALLHVVRRQGRNLFNYLFRKERMYTRHVNKIQQLFYFFLGILINSKIIN